MSLASLAFDSPVLTFMDRGLPSPKDDAENAKFIREQKRDIKNLKNLAYALGIRKIVWAHRKACDNDGLAGQYFYARSKGEHRFLNDWNLSPRQLASITRELRNGRDVIVLDPVMADDPFSALAHEIGHHINHRLGGLSPFESSFFTNSDLAQLSQVTANMRRVARFDAYYAQNKDEFYAEAWSLFLCGENRPTLFRYLSRPLRRLRVRHPEAARLIEGCRQIV